MALSLGLQPAACFSVANALDRIVTSFWRCCCFDTDCSLVHMATKSGDDVFGHQVPNRDLPQRLMAS